MSAVWTYEELEAHYRDVLNGLHDTQHDLNIPPVASHSVDEALIAALHDYHRRFNQLLEFAADLRANPDRLANPVRVANSIEQFASVEKWQPPPAAKDAS